MEKKQRIQKAYKASKGIYDDVLTRQKLWTRLYISFFWGVDDYDVARRVSNHIAGDFAGKLLDVPVGTGVFTAGLYSRLPGAEIIALDYSVDMLEQAKARFASESIGNISCEQGDVGALTYQDAVFDTVLSMNGLHAFPEKDKAFAETSRVLKQGGIFMGCTYIRGERRRTDFAVKRILAPRGWFTPPFWTKDELTAILRKHYCKVEVENLNAMAVFRCVK
jgi:ubiquinone/menaquinone biosynthesis C-methylase UbiE